MDGQTGPADAHPLFGNRLTASRAGETIARDHVRPAASVEPHASWSRPGTTTPSRQVRAGSGGHPPRSPPSSTSAANTGAPAAAPAPPARRFRARPGAHVHRDRAWPKPEGKLFTWSDETLAALELYYVLNGVQTVQLGSLAVTLNPEWLGKQYLERADVAVLQAIRDQLGRRPIYFSRTVGLYADQFGFTSHLEGHGFARKLAPQPLVQSDSVVAVPSLGYLNLARSRALLFDVYHTATATRQRPRGWLDNPSEGILSLYGVTYQTMAPVLQPIDSTLSLRRAGHRGLVYRTQLPAAGQLAGNDGRWLWAAMPPPSAVAAIRLLVSGCGRWVAGFALISVA
jgi:hypothetical protein